jgi:hypothetical protein
MHTKIMTWLAVAALLAAAIWSPSAGFRILLEFVVCAGAIVTIQQAANSSNYLAGAGFAIIALLFNPLVPLPFSRGMFLWLDVFCMAAFLTSLVAFKTQPRLSIASITDRTPGSESL